ncbi:MAG TPA: DUF4190 domain-containing protein [Pseudonocardiaceae bacterium]
MTFPVPTQPRNGFGTAGFIVGLIGLVLAFIPVIGVVAWPLVIIGLVLSAIGLIRSARVHSRRGLSIAGVIVSVIGLIICIVWATAFGSAVQQVQNDKLAPVSSSQAPAAKTPQHSAVFTLSAGQAVNVQYGDLGEEKSIVVQPTKQWTQTFTFGGGSHYLSLSALPVSSSDFTSPVTCEITVDGKQLAQQSNPAGVFCTATVNE